MYRFSFPTRPLLSFMESATSRWRLPAHGRQASPHMVFPNLPVRRFSRLSREPQNTATISREKGDESGKPYMGESSSANAIIICQGNKHMNTTGIISEVITGDGISDASEVIYAKHDIMGEIVKHTGCDEEHQRSATEYYRGGIVSSNDKEVSDDEEYTVNNILAKSRHRDGSIYRGTDTWWKKDYCIADRNETHLEAMAFSSPTDCIIHNGTCMQHLTCCMLQILSLKLAKLPVDCSLVDLYGYVAVRDNLEPLLNYVVNFSRDDPIAVEHGSLIKMAGPKRGIEMLDNILIEYDMRIKIGKEEKDDLQLIDGASIIGPACKWNEPFTIRIPGDYGAVDMTLSRLHSSVEATVEVLILEVRSSFDLSVGCLTSGLHEEMCLFDGTITEACCGLKRSVVAVQKDSSLDLTFNIGAGASNYDQHFCSFKAVKHGHETQEIKAALGLISVKVTWSTLPCY